MSKIDKYILFSTSSFVHSSLHEKIAIPSRVYSSSIRSWVVRRENREPRERSNSTGPILSGLISQFYAGS